MRVYVENDGARVRVVGCKQELTKALKDALRVIGAGDAHRVELGHDQHLTFEAFPEKRRDA